MVSRALQLSGNIDETVLHTGQHYSAEMSEIFFSSLGLTEPHYHLNIHDLPHAAMTGRMMEGIEKVIAADKPDGVVVYGDTNSTLAGALAARMAQLPLFHVEAGMRTAEPDLPEQLNRVVTDRIAQRLFCSTFNALDTLKMERPDLDAGHLIHSGDVLLDAYLHYSGQAQSTQPLLKELAHQPFILATIHRSYNTDDEKRLKDFVTAFNALHKEVPVVMTLHPRTGVMMNKFGIQPEFHCIPSVGYLEMLAWLKACKLVITDSGGLQKEAAFAGKFCITMRRETEWVELAAAGINKICGDQTDLMMEAARNFIKQSFPGCPDTYGKGNASEIIAKGIYSYYNF